MNKIIHQLSNQLFHKRRCAMKIAIRSKDGKTVSDSTTSFSGYMIYELDGENMIRSEFRRCRPSYQEEIHNIDDCEAVISRAIAPEVKEFLVKEGKEVIITFKTSPEEALRSFMKQKLYSGTFIS